ncbi:flagellar export protein FliJ [Wenzhouxiangella sp. XN24]|uniref:flagellar export protein FliJ n=1 Tax=Wenzhouxiangella sp. XN24 TaxID=2713569 RepID=UPI0013EC2C64|nr:flagellar export protein FliJ [Wenzhouxiangella sp. XN24]NGX16233.1 flagellar export protein FliJ [Wenzhouxiangella sp. XN24]
MSEMLRSRRLEPIARVADHREQAAAQEFGRFQEVVATQELRLAELRAWWREYADGLEAQANRDCRALREGRLFLAQLTEAIEKQQNAVEHARRDLEAARARWVTSRMDHEALEKVVGRYQDEESREARRGEQREQDECAMRGRRSGP